MKAEELRIGNQIHNTRGDIVEVCIETLVFITNYPEESNRLKPIKLTDVVLEKLGFEKQRTGYPKDHKDYFEWHEKEFPVIGYLVKPSERQFLYDEETDTLRIEYLHQLQNLIYATSGIELKLT